MKISIITINYNNLKGLQKTVDSVIHQTYDELEYIIIDGGSSDGSKDYIESNKEYFNYWVSGPDNGPYDAMNKGIDQATGDFFLFLNSGDYFANNTVIEKFSGLQSNEQIVYGDCLVEKKGKLKRLKMPSNLNPITSLLHTINHQCIFYNKELFEKGRRYDCNYKIVADWVFTNNAIIKLNSSTKHIDLVISVYDLNGMSSDKNLRVNEREKYLKLNFDSNYLRLLKEYNGLYVSNIRFRSNYLIKTMLILNRMINNLKSRF